MRRKSTYIMILLLLFVSITLTTSRERASHDFHHHLGNGTLHYEFVLVRDASFEEQLPQIKVRDTSAPLPELLFCLGEYTPKTLIHKSNAYFMTRRNCVCVPLRL